MHYVYVLISKKNGKRYTGYSQKLPILRLKEHNSGSNTWTSQNGPFDLLYSESLTSGNEARKREIYFKSAAGRKYSKKLAVVA